MEKKLAGLLGAVAGLATIGSAQAAVAPAANPSGAPASYADLLNPIPNAVEQLKADDLARAQEAADGLDGAKLAQVYYPYPPPYYYHHHHHHHAYWRHHHHHHHHHHRGVIIGLPGGVVIGR